MRLSFNYPWALTEVLESNGPQREYIGTVPHVGDGQGPREPSMYLEQERKWAWCVTEEKHNAYTGEAEGHLMPGKYKRQKEQTSNGKWRKPVQAGLGWFRERNMWNVGYKGDLRDSEDLRSRGDYEVCNTSDYGLEEAQEERTLTESLTPWTPWTSTLDPDELRHIILDESEHVFLALSTWISTPIKCEWQHPSCWVVILIVRSRMTLSTALTRKMPVPIPCSLRFLRHLCKGKQNLWSPSLLLF